MGELESRAPRCKYLADVAHRVRTAAGSASVFDHEVNADSTVIIDTAPSAIEYGCGMRPDSSDTYSLL
jgi:hypothetical protein